MIQNLKDGFIFIYVLLLSFLILSLGTYLFNRGVTFPSFVKTSVRNEQSEQIAFSGLELARSLLSHQRQKQEKNKTPKNSDAFNDINILFPTINQWQNFDLKENIDGIDATFKICLTSEEGKININALFDFKNKKFAQEKLVDAISIRLETLGIKDFKSHLEQFFKKRGYPLTIITELLEDDYFVNSFKDRIFYEPSKQENKQSNIYLTDLFTTYTIQELTINPWLLSDSVSVLFDVSRAAQQKEENRKKHIQSLKNEFKTQYTWKTDYKKFLQPMYEKSIENYISFLKNDVVFRYFGVLCEATFFGSVKKIYAILQRKERAQEDEIMYDVNIIQIYFL